MKFDFSTWDLSADTEFDVATSNLSRLEIRPVDGNANLCYFYDPDSRRLVKDFVLSDGDKVRTLMNVTLVKKMEKFEPRVRLWKRVKPKSAAATEEVPGQSEIRTVKASVDVGEGHQAFWQVVAFVQIMTGATVPSGAFRVVPADAAELAELLRGQDKGSVVTALKLTIGAELTQEDIDLITDRRSQLEEFRRLLEDEEYFATQRKSKSGDEAVWQDFFERNQWIFGYGLTFLACEALSDARLERVTTGANVFTGAGKRSDAVMRTKGFLSSLLFGEIKTHKTNLLAGTPYRPPDVYSPSSELSGAVAQVQKTADKAVRYLQQKIYAVADDSGVSTGVDVLTVHPRQVLVIGHLQQLMDNKRINEEKAHSFELFRRSILGLEILTFDELYERAWFIVGDTKDAARR